MFTVCPKCTLTLVVTTVDLRAGQGYVRCGRCANVFNALIALREGDPNTALSDTGKRRLMETAPRGSVQPALGAGVEVDPEPQSEAVDETPEPEAEIESEGESEAPAADPSLEFDAAATDVSEIFVAPPEEEHDTTSGNYESVVLGEDDEPAPATEPEQEPDVGSHIDTISAGEWSLLDDDDVPADAESVIEESPLVEPEPEVDESGNTVVEEANTPDPAWVHEMFAEAEADAVRARTGEREALQVNEDDADVPLSVRAARDASGSAAPSDTVLEPLLSTPERLRPPWQSIAGISVLGVALILQVLNHYRQSLVLNPTLGPAVAKVYGWFGATPTPRWDLNAYSVKQLGAESEGAEGTRLRVRLSVQNDSDRVQPLPLLRLTLQDRYGNAVATRDLEPREYLPARVSDLRLLDPGKRIDAELHVIDPGKAAIGFEIDACLRGETGAVGCANEVRRRTPG